MRKYAFDKMIELEVPESVADFIQARALQTKVRIVGERELAKKVADCIATNFEVKRRERFNRTPYRYAEAYATGVSYYMTVKKEKENVSDRGNTERV